MSYYSKNDPVAVVPLSEYTPESARAALEAVLSPIGGLDFVKSGLHIVIKTVEEDLFNMKHTLKHAACVSTFIFRVTGDHLK